MKIYIYTEAVKISFVEFEPKTVNFDHFGNNCISKAFLKFYKLINYAQNSFETIKIDQL